MRSHYRGVAGEYLAAAYFAFHGFDVWWSDLNHSPVDLRLTKGNLEYRVQVKLAARRGAKHTVVLSSGSAGKIRSYALDAFDLLVVIHPTAPKLWIIPWQEVASAKRLTMEGYPQYEETLYPVKKEEG